LIRRPNENVRRHQNIDHLKKVLETSTVETQRKEILRQIAEEEATLKQLSTNNGIQAVPTAGGN